jgi:hypothetical protein
MLKYNVKLFSKLNEKIFKVTFSGVDKFLTNTEIENTISKVNEIKLLRVNKSTNKNYCHIELSSLHTQELIKQKLNTIKFLGKTVKVRVKELEFDDKDNVKEAHNILDTTTITNENLKEVANKFYIKNLLSNPMNVKELISELESNNKLIKQIKTKQDIYNFDYKIDLKSEDSPFLNFRYNMEFHEDKKNKEKVECIYKIIEKLTLIFDQLNFTSYDPKRRKGTLREFQIKFNGNRYICNLMMSKEEITNVDIRCLADAIKYEFKDFKDLSFYFSYNESILGKGEDSPIFEFIDGVEECLYQDGLYIYPFDTDYQFYLKYVNVFEVFGRKTFTNVIDKTSGYMPYSTLCDLNTNAYNFNPDDYKFKIIKGGETIQPLRTNKKNIEQIQDLDYQNSLLFLNIKKYHQKIDFVPHIKYQLLTSNSFNQILDYLKTYPSKSVKFKKIHFIKTGIYEVDEIVLALELI